MAQAVELRPLTLGELLDKAFSLYRGNFVLFAGIAMIPGLFYFAMSLVQSVIQAATESAQRDPAAGAGLLGAMLLGLVVMMLSFIFYLYAYFLSMGAAVFAVSDLYLGRTTTIREAYGRIRGMAGRVFNVVISTGLRIFLGFLLLIIPGMLLAARYSLALPACVLENLKTREAIRRSILLAEGAWGRILLILLLNVILTWAAAALLQVPLVALGQLTGSTLAAGVLSALGELLATVLVAPVYTIAIGLQYYDSRVRKEAFDLQHLMQALEAPGAAPAAAVTPAVS